MASLLLSAFFIFLSRQSLAIPMSVQTCVSPEVMKVPVASKLELSCVSPCSDSELPQKYEWTKVREGTEKQLTIQDQKLVINSVSYDDRGTYKCRCLAGDTWCEQTVQVQSRSFLEFTSSHPFIIPQEENTKLVCRVTTSNDEKPLYPVIELIRTKEILRTSRNNEHHQKFESWVVVSDIKIPKEDFRCYVDVVDKVGQVMDRLQKNLTIYSYSPPEVDTGNDAFLSKIDMGGSGEVSCTVVKSPDVETKVTWHRNNEEEELQPSRKYDMTVEGTSEAGTFTYILKVNNLQMSDIGEYTCRVRSQFNVEDQKIVSIEIEREDEDFKPNEDSEEHRIVHKTGGGWVSTFPVNATIVVSVLVIGAIIWRCCSWRRIRYPLSKNGNISFSSTGDSGFQNDDMNLFRRKYKHVQ